MRPQTLPSWSCLMSGKNGAEFIYLKNKSKVVFFLPEGLSGVCIVKGTCQHPLLPLLTSWIVLFISSFKFTFFFFVLPQTA